MRHRSVISPLARSHAAKVIARADRSWPGPRGVGSDEGREPRPDPANGGCHDQRRRADDRNPPVPRRHPGRRPGRASAPHRGDPRAGALLERGSGGVQAATHVTIVERVHMPSLDGATGWINSEPLTPAGLRGKVVLVDFWTLTCINWLRTEPYIRAWSQAYRDDGLVVLGVHTPEFSFEHDLDLVRQAVRERAIDYPVAVDNDYAVWSAFANNYWPALYVVDRDGVIRDHHFGEGRYEHSERVVQQLLGVEREPVSIEGVGVEADADWEHLQTPETYLGDGRGERRSYESPERLRLGEWSLAGDWAVGPEKAALRQAGGSIAFRFH